MTTQCTFKVLDHAGYEVFRCNKDVAQTHPRKIKVVSKGLRGLSVLFRRIQEDKKATIQGDGVDCCIVHHKLLLAATKRKDNKNAILDIKEFLQGQALPPMMVRTIIDGIHVSYPAAAPAGQIITQLLPFANGKKRKYSNLKDGGREQKCRRNLVARVKQLILEENNCGEDNATMDFKGCATLLVSGPRLSSRGYKDTARIMKRGDPESEKPGVILQTYNSVTKWMKKNWKTTKILVNVCKVQACKSCAVTSFVECCQTFFSVKRLYEKLRFWETGPGSKTEQVYKHLLESTNRGDGDDSKPTVKSGLMYSNFDINARTVMIRLSWDGFGASGNSSMERSSFYFLNLPAAFDNIPAFEILLSLYKDKESRKSMEDHLGSSNGYPFESMPEDLKMNMLGELSRACHEGITLKVPGKEVPEYFNLFVFFVPDLSCLEKVLGRMPSGCKAGGCWCHKTLADRNDGENRDIFPLRDMEIMFEKGRASEKAIAIGLGEGKSRDWCNSIGNKYDGQKEIPLFYFGGIQFCPPDLLHLMLALYRIMWKMVLYYIINCGKIIHDNEEVHVPRANVKGPGAKKARDAAKLAQEEKKKRQCEESVFIRRLPAALREVGLNRMAIGLQKALDDNEAKKTKIKPTDKVQINGNDGKKLETVLGRIFEIVFSKDGVDLTQDQLRKIQKLRDNSKNILLAMNYLHKFSVILRNPYPKEEELERCDLYIEKFIVIFDVESRDKFIVDKSIYYHVLRDDLPRFNRYCIKVFGFSLARLWSSNGEHSNKVQKVGELNETNLDENSMLRLMILNQWRLFYCWDVFVKYIRDVTCSLCKVKGHMKSNKMCSMHNETRCTDWKSYFSADANVVTQEELGELETVPKFMHFNYEDPVVDQLNEVQHEVDSEGDGEVDLDEDTEEDEDELTLEF